MIGNRNCLFHCHYSLFYLAMMTRLARQQHHINCVVEAVYSDLTKLITRTLLKINMKLLDLTL